ncbi:MAG: NADH-quinone oxidoreductase subunit NuoF [Spirochaetaceae bacterium]|jgi:NADH-quinone oxidoreductase subunit F|nr:NADH-quinone oxidoreductase subunit NuoF [Spirochaetaceae bacterium]
MKQQKREILVCCGTGCIANGAPALFEALGAAIAAAPDAALREKVAKVEETENIKRTGCNGFCENGPMVKIMPDDIVYYRVRKEDAPEIVAALRSGSVVERLLYTGENGEKVRSQQENPFYTRQMKIALRNAGAIEPANIADYRSRRGFEALRKALGMESTAVIAELEKSGLRGRGGAGFPTGRKWRECAASPDFPKYVVCNGDEGDPGAFMDRSLMEGDPHGVIEGLTIAALAVGAHEGFMYIRDEYGLAITHVEQALASARAAGFLGKNILGSGFDFDIAVVRGGGAFVCGESSALMASIEGKSGEPRTKYIRSVEKGLWDKPTVLNNVETLANVPYIILHGGDSYGAIGLPASTGTKVFALVGKVKRTGLVEVPMGTTLRTLIYDIGGGITGNRPFKAVQTGGPSGGCIPESLLDLSIDFDSLLKYGSMMGSGGIIVMDDRTCMVEVARYYAGFLSEESCGKCTPCREGLRRQLRILTNICEGRGEPGDLAELESLGRTMQDAALCALGRTAPNPILSGIRYFREEYEAHIHEKRCPAGVCAGLTRFVIQSGQCKGCGRCIKACPAGAIDGEKKSPHRIDPAACLRCGACRDVCAFDAIEARGA